MGQVGPMDKCPDYQGVVISGIWMCVHLYKWDNEQVFTKTADYPVETSYNSS